MNIQKHIFAYALTFELHEKCFDIIDTINDISYLSFQLGKSIHRIINGFLNLFLLIGCACVIVLY